LENIVEKINSAKSLLNFIGGTAHLVAGQDGHYWADQQTPKKVHAKPQIGRGNFGKNLMAKFDHDNNRSAARFAAHHNYLAHQAERKRIRAEAKQTPAVERLAA
jgi:hypothetical protein